MYKYVDTHIYVYVCMYIYMYIYICIYIFIYIYTYLCIYVFMYSFIHLHVYIYNISSELAIEFTPTPPFTRPAHWWPATARPVCSSCCPSLFVFIIYIERERASERERERERDFELIPTLPYRLVRWWTLTALPVC